MVASSDWTSYGYPCALASRNHTSSEKPTCTSTDRRNTTPHPLDNKAKCKLQVGWAVWLGTTTNTKKRGTFLRTRRVGVVAVGAKRPPTTTIPSAVRISQPPCANRRGKKRARTGKPDYTHTHLPCAVPIPSTNGGKVQLFPSG